jgi:hypothetical protein
MTYNDLIQLYFERSNALQSLWTLYVVVIGGLLAFSSIRKQRDLLTTALVTVLYSFFAYKNLGAIHDITVQRFATLEAIQQFSPAPAEAATIQQVRALLDPTLRPPEFIGVRNFHVASDLLTIAALWAMERRRQKVA